jgi:hypothetical protein
MSHPTDRLLMFEPDESHTTDAALQTAIDHGGLRRENERHHFSPTPSFGRLSVRVWGAPYGRNGCTGLH